jgi:hypothetical protein
VNESVCGAVSENEDEEEYEDVLQGEGVEYFDWENNKDNGADAVLNDGEADDEAAVENEVKADVLTAAVLEAVKVERSDILRVPALVPDDSALVEKMDDGEKVALAQDVDEADCVAIDTVALAVPKETLAKAEEERAEDARAESDAALPLACADVAAD